MLHLRFTRRLNQARGASLRPRHHSSDGPEGVRDSERIAARIAAPSACSHQKQDVGTDGHVAPENVKRHKSSPACYGRSELRGEDIGMIKPTARNAGSGIFRMGQLRAQAADCAAASLPLPETMTAPAPAVRSWWRRRRGTASFRTALLPPSPVLYRRWLPVASVLRYLPARTDMSSLFNAVYSACHAVD